MNSRISVVSSLATDTLVDESGNILARQQGGPALFIQCSLKKEGLPFRLFSSPPIEVEILVKADGEYGRIMSSPEQTRPNPQDLNEWTIMSTIVDEWQLTKPYPEKLFVDLQGYVRAGQQFGKKGATNAMPLFVDDIFCLKGTAEEISCLPQAIIENQKKNILIVTNGNNDVEICNGGMIAKIPVRTVLGLPDTIGAGDTFFGYFVASMFKGSSSTDAARYAINQTAKFLEKKLRTEDPL